jgi:tetratricopeptide (TPR) repeat protein
MLRISGLFVHLGLVGTALYLYRRQRPGLVTGLALFYIALLPASGLFGPGAGSRNLAERFLYEPTIGLAVLLAFGLHYLLRQGNRLLTTAPVVLAVCLLTPLTWARNADWSDDMALLEHDYRHGVRERGSLQALTKGLVVEGRYGRAVEVCRENEKSRWQSGMLSLNCGSAYLMVGDPQRAEQAFLDATADEAMRSRAHSNLSYLYVTEGRHDEAGVQLEKAIESEKNPATRAYRRGLLLLRRYPDDRPRLLEARGHFEEALRLQPRHADAIEALEAVNRILERPR